MVKIGVFMTLEEKISYQRVKHIISSYQLDGTEGDAFASCLEELLDVYATPIIELALAETLAAVWLRVPMPRGIEFLSCVDDRLQAWALDGITRTLTPEEFHHITGLDPLPVFQSLDFPPPTILRRP